METEKIDETPKEQVSSIKRREEYEEKLRSIFAKYVGDNGGVLTQGISEEECEKAEASMETEIFDAQEEFIDVIREDLGFKPDDTSVKFTKKRDDKRWQRLVGKHNVKFDGKPSAIYKDGEGKYRIIPGEKLNFLECEFYLKNFNDFICESDVDEDILPSFNIMGRKVELEDEYVKMIPNIGDESKSLNDDPLCFEHQILIATIAMVQILQVKKEKIKDDPLFNELKKLLV